MLKKIIAIILIIISNIINADVINIYAHRGYRPISPENTLPAYIQAVHIGVDVIDMDVNMTKDKILVVTHDLTLNPDITKDEHNRWIKQRIPIKNLTLTQLQKYNIGYIKPGSKTAKMYPHHININNLHISTLEEIINYFKSNFGNRIKLQIELKTNPYNHKESWSAKEMAKALNKILIKTKMFDNVEVQSFEWKVLIYLQNLNSKIKTAYLTDSNTEPMNHKQAQIKINYKKWTSPIDPKDYNYNYPLIIHKLGGTFWEPYEKDLTKNLLDKAHKLGIKVITWSWTEKEGTDFNYSTINKLINWRVDGIITDRPDILRGLEAAKGLNLPAAY